MGIKKVALLMLMYVGRISAWESALNPDRHVSFALDYSNGVLNGSGVSTEYLYSLNGNTNVPKEDSTINSVELFSINPSMRFPVSNRLTIDLAWAYINQKYDYAGYLTRFHGNLKGQICTVGFRYYFPD